MTKNNPDNDAFDAIEKIKAAEEQAREILQEAREKTAFQIIHDAQDEAEKIKERFLAEAKEKAEGIKKKIIDSAKRQRDEIETESDQEISDLRHETRSRISHAVETTKKRVAELLDQGVS
jgi:vacuolar-type H+-ATPase subunit H